MERCILLLLLHTVVCVCLPAPHNVSIASINMEHTLHFLPGNGTPPHTHFRVHVLRPRRTSWRPVLGCEALVASEACDLSACFRDPLQQYQARVQAFLQNHTSPWALAPLFQPLTHTVLGPPDVSLSGCGNCLLLQVSPPSTRGRRAAYLPDLYRGLHCVVRRTRDGAQFTVNVAYKTETVISYLQPGVEYCLTVTVTMTLNPHSVPSEPHCAFTSPPSTISTGGAVVSLLCVFCVFTLLLIAAALYRIHLSSRLPRKQLANLRAQGWSDQAHM